MNNAYFSGNTFSSMPLQSFPEIKDWYFKELENFVQGSLEKQAGTDEETVKKHSELEFISELRVYIKQQGLLTREFNATVKVTARLFLEFMEQRERELREKGSEPPQLNEYPHSLVKIQWNGQKNALTDLFRQLKTIVNEKGEPLISSSNENLAVFLKSNFTCFEDTDLSTLNTMLKTENAVKKTNKKVLIECKKIE